MLQVIHHPVPQLDFDENLEIKFSSWKWCHQMQLMESFCEVKLLLFGSWYKFFKTHSFTNWPDLGPNFDQILFKFEQILKFYLHRHLQQPHLIPGTVSHCVYHYQPPPGTNPSVILTSTPSATPSSPWNGFALCLPLSTWTLRAPDAMREPSRFNDSPYLLA